MKINKTKIEKKRKNIKCERKKIGDCLKYSTYDKYYRR
jgi:hypothetical protein